MGNGARQERERTVEKAAERGQPAVSHSPLLLLRRVAAVVVLHGGVCAAAAVPFLVVPVGAAARRRATAPRRHCHEDDEEEEDAGGAAHVNWEVFLRDLPRAHAERERRVRRRRGRRKEGGRRGGRACRRRRRRRGGGGGGIQGRRGDLQKDGKGTHCYDRADPISDRGEEKVIRITSSETLAALPCSQARNISAKLSRS